MQLTFDGIFQGRKAEIRIGGQAKPRNLWYELKLPF
jgi:hypothetical protein